MKAPAKNIVIIGAGFTGSTVAREPRARLSDGYMRILISKESYLTFNPMLPEVVGASIFPGRVVAPLRQMLDLRGASRFIMGHVVAVDRVATRSRGMMAAIGNLNGVADVFGIRLSGLPARLIWRAYYLSQMPTFGRKLRIFVEWAWGMFFPPDITHFRFTRSTQVIDRSNEKLGHQVRSPKDRNLSIRSEHPNIFHLER